LICIGRIAASPHRRCGVGAIVDVLVAEGRVQHDIAFDQAAPEAAPTALAAYAPVAEPIY